MKILIDGDSCPVKNIVIGIAKELNIDVVLVKSISHHIVDEYAKIITVDKGRDRADIVLINNTVKGDIVVTQDYGLAALVLSKKAYAINQRGLVFNDDNIEMLLMRRHENEKNRRKHKKYTKIPKRSKDDDEKFEIEFRKLLKDIKV